MRLGRSLAHLRQLWGLSSAPDLPELLGLWLTHDAIGTSRLAEIQFSNQSVVGAGAAANVALATVPAKKVWWILCANVWLSTFVASGVESMVRVDRTSNEVFLASADLADANTRIIVRDFLLGPGERLRARDTNLALGATLDLSAQFVEIELGEAAPR